MNITPDTFLISDTHFGQDSIAKKEKIRKILASHLGFENHFDFMTYVWNRKIKPNDSVLHLGDVYFKDGIEYLRNLNGKKQLIIGNNDVKKYKHIQKLGWEMKNKIILKIPHKDRILEKIRKKYPKIPEAIFLNGIIADIDGERILFSHFPVFNRKVNDRFSEIRDVLDDYFRFCDCSLNIHGHTHSRDTGNAFCINVSVEKTMLAPVKLKHILKEYRRLK